MVPAGGSTSTVRLVRGSKDPQGLWAYGVLQLQVEGVWREVDYRQSRPRLGAKRLLSRSANDQARLRSPS